MQSGTPYPQTDHPEFGRDSQAEGSYDPSIAGCQYFDSRLFLYDALTELTRLTEKKIDFLRTIQYNIWPQIQTTF